jgi:hypothetical protein
MGCVDGLSGGMTDYPVGVGKIAKNLTLSNGFNELTDCLVSVADHPSIHL